MKKLIRITVPECPGPLWCCTWICLARTSESQKRRLECLEKYLRVFEHTFELTYTEKDATSNQAHPRPDGCSKSGTPDSGLDVTSDSKNNQPTFWLVILLRDFAICPVLMCESQDKHRPSNLHDHACVATAQQDRWSPWSPQASYDRRRHRNCFPTRPAQAFPKK